MRKIFKKFNLHSHTLEDVLKIAKRERINIVYYPMLDTIKGYYNVERKNVYRKRFIAINEKLSQPEILAVLLHELVHHFLHVSGARKQTFYCRADRLNDSKHDAEAEAIGTMLMISQDDLFEMEKTPFEDIHPFLQKKLIERRQIYLDLRQ